MNLYTNRRICRSSSYKQLSSSTPRIQRQYAWHLHPSSGFNDFIHPYSLCLLASHQTGTMTAMAGPSRGPDTWQPTRYLEPNKPDNEEVLEQAAYQAAITRQPGERAKKYKPRKTVDFMGGVLKWRQVRQAQQGPQAKLMTDDQVERTACGHACDTS